MMRAIRFRPGPSVTLEELPLPALRPGEVLLRVRAAGLCHTDFEILRGNYGAGAFPLVPCHEFAGEIVALGEGVAQDRLGARVVVSPNLGCGQCRGCRAGRVNLCEALGAYGVSEDGGFAEYARLRLDRLVPAGDLPFGIAALAEPLGCVLNALSPLAPALSAGRIGRALIFGAGPMGVLMALALRHHGVGEVILAEPLPVRRDLARAFGFEARDPADLAALRHAADLAVDASGRTEVAASLLDHVAAGGHLLFFGVCPKGESITLPPFEMFRRQISAFGTHSLNDPDLPAAIALLARIGPDIARLVSHRLSLEEMAEVLRAGPPAAALKLQVAFG